MTLKERLFTIGRALTSRAESVEQKEKSITGGFFDYSSNLVTHTKASDRLLASNTGWVYKNNDVIAKEVATIDFELFTMRVVGGKVEFNPILSHPLLDLLDRFNEFTTSADGIYNTVSHKNLAGDAFWYLEGKAPNITDIYLLQPDKITLKLGERKAGQKIIQSYEYNDSIEGDVVNETYDADEIVHFKNPDPNNQYRGKSKVVAAAETIDTDNLAVEANKGIFLRGMINNFVLTTPNNLTPEQMKQLRAELQANYGGSKNAFKAMILSGGMEPKAISLTNKEMEFIDQQKWLRDKIMSIFGNTPSSIGIVEDVNRANSESGILHWKRTTIKSEMKNVTDTINEFLVPKFGSNLILSFKDPVPEDRDTKIEEVKTLIESNVITQDEAREILGYDPLKKGTSGELRRQTTEQIPSIPKSLLNIDYQKVLRKNGIYNLIEKDNHLLDVARKVATKMVKSRKKQADPTPAREHQTFSNDQVWGFHDKQIRIVESLEAKFENKVRQFINKIVDEAISNVPDEIPAMKSKALVNEDALVVQAGIDFTPILKEVAILSGQQALSLINDDQPYIATDIDKVIAESVNKFAHSMIDTDRDKIIDIISEGVSSGDSIPKIRKRITEDFEEFSKSQANRITRTEVIRASNQASLDAWENSDVVVGKQWLTAMDDRVDSECRALNGKVLGLEGVYEKNDYLDVEVPPLHPNCRCTLLPVLEDQKAFDAETSLKMKELQADKAELEDKLDKRTKKYKELKDKDLKLEEHVKELEKLVDEISSED